MGLGAPYTSVFRRHLATALSNMLKLMVIPELVRQMDMTNFDSPFQLNYSVLFQLAVYKGIPNIFSPFGVTKETELFKESELIQFMFASIN